MAVRVVTDAAKLRENWRICLFAISNLFLSTQRILQSATRDMNAIELQIYITVAIANVQKLMRERALPDDLNEVAVLPREWVVPISRNAIASATGLPRETVRRHVGRMIAAGLLVEDPRGGVTTTPNNISLGRFALLLEPMMAEFTRAAEMLIRHGILYREEV